MKELKKKLHVLHELNGDLSLFIVPSRAWLLFELGSIYPIILILTIIKLIYN